MQKGYFKDFKVLMSDVFTFVEHSRASYFFFIDLTYWNLVQQDGKKTRVGVIQHIGVSVLLLGWTRAYELVRENYRKDLVSVKTILDVKRFHSSFDSDASSVKQEMVSSYKESV